jgi:hypothetical protein
MTVAAPLLVENEEVMSDTPALPLAQQVLAWMLQGLGLLDHLSISRSTAKNALRGEVISRSWDDLVDDAIDAFGFELQADQRALLRRSMRSVDKRLSSLHTLELPVEDRLPAVLHIFIPKVGCRLGALAAMVEGGLWPDVRTAVPELGNWITDPLSPRTFGRIVEGLLAFHHPEWATWDERKTCLDKKNIASAKSVERWRSAQVAVPNLSNVKALATIMGDDEQQRRAALLLRLGRLLTVMRRELAGWADEMQAEAVSLAVSAWARGTRDALLEPGLLADIADGWADAVEGPNGDQVVSALGSLLGNASPVAEPTDVASELRRTASVVRDTGDPTPLRLVQAQALLGPNPVVISAVGRHLGAPAILEVELMDPVERIQGEWTTIAILRAVAVGELLRPEATAAEGRPNRKPTAELRNLARRLLEQARTIVRSPDADPPDNLDPFRFMFSLLA